MLRLVAVDAEETLELRLNARAVADDRAPARELGEIARRGGVQHRVRQRLDDRGGPERDAGSLLRISREPHIAGGLRAPHGVEARRLSVPRELDALTDPELQGPDPQSHVVPHATERSGMDPSVRGRSRLAIPRC